MDGQVKPRSPERQPASDKEEIRILKARIQGFVTLENLFIESKNHNKALKRENDELKRTLDQREPVGPSSLLHQLSSSDSLNSLTERKRLLNETDKTKLSSSGHASVASENNELESEPMDTEVTQGAQSFDKDAVLVSGPIAPNADMTQQSLEIDPYDLRLDNVKFGDGRSSPTVHVGASKNPLAEKASSPTTLSESIVLISPESWGNSQLMTQVRLISEVLSRNVGMESTSELSDALARLSINVLKIEKQLLLKQEMINHLSPENHQMKDHLESKLQDRERVIEIYKREKEELETQVKEYEEQMSRRGNTEWVHVGSPTQEKINEVNLRWEERAKELESVHNSQVRQLQSHLSECRKRLGHSEELDKKRQDDIDKLLLVAKKRAEEEKAAKVHIMNQLYQEEERRHRVEANLMSERRRAEALSDQISALEAQLAIFNESRLASMLPLEQNTSMGGRTNSDLQTEVQILKQQVSIFKEDFDRERADRERIQGEKDVLLAAIGRYKTDLTVTQQKVRQMEQEKGMLTSENTCLRQEFQQIRQGDQDLAWIQTENNHLKEQLAQKIAEVHRLKTAARASRPLSPQDAPWSDPTGTPSEMWTCNVCTFMNHGMRSSCEVCGRSRSRSSQTANMSSRLIPHSPPVRGWTECDTGRTPITLTKGDDLIIDQDEDQLDNDKK